MSNGNDVRDRVNALPAAARKTLRRRLFDKIAKEEVEGESTILTNALMLAITDGLIKSSDILGVTQ
jgi:hypothetical protein